MKTRKIIIDTIRQLSQRGKVPVKEVCKRVVQYDISPSTVYYHISKLEKEGRIKTERIGREKYVCLQ